MIKLFLLLVLTVTPAIAESSNAKNLHDLNRQMWMPFVEGIRTDRADLYVGIHSKDFYWVAPGSEGRVMNLTEYDEDSRMVMARRKKAGERTEVEFRFLERNVRDSFAAEKCIVRFVLHRPDKAPEASYGIAHFFSRKENGVWRMWLQHGSTEKATEAAFIAAAPLEELERFSGR